VSILHEECCLSLDHAIVTRYLFDYFSSRRGRDSVKIDQTQFADLLSDLITDENHAPLVVDHVSNGNAVFGLTFKRFQTQIPIIKPQKRTLKRIAQIREGNNRRLQALGMIPSSTRGGRTPRREVTIIPLLRHLGHLRNLYRSGLRQISRRNHLMISMYCKGNYPSLREKCPFSVKRE